MLEFVGVKTRGILTEKGTMARNDKRIKNSAVKCSDKGKKRRKTLRTIKKVKSVKIKTNKKSNSHDTGRNEMRKQKTPKTIQKFR